MAYATVLGATGYSGQETLDRILAHPELELHAVGSDSLAGKSAAELDPRLNRNGGKRGPHFVTTDDAIEPHGVVIDAKSGMTGAGRTLKASSHAGFVLENVSPYKVGRHQHAPGIEQALGFPVTLVPHLLPVRRGLIATCYVQPKTDL